MDKKALLKLIFCCVLLFLVINTANALAGWSPMDCPTTRNLKGIWGSSPTDIFVVGSDEATLHFDGNQWTVMQNDVST